MNYIAMIQNRRSVRAFRSKEVSDATLAELRTHYERNCRRLIPELATELVILDADAQSALEGRVPAVPHRRAALSDAPQRPAYPCGGKRGLHDGGTGAQTHRA